MNASTRPIRPVEWIPASQVLRHEERDFTVWLADNLDLLGEALGFDDLRLVERESRVESFRADIVAAAHDGSDDGLPVVIENQYGRTNHDHLGKVITYLAAQQRGLGVWVVEEVSQAHIAAVEFLNRTSDDTVGYAIVVVRFAPAPDDGHYVDFDVVAEPNEWMKAATTPTTGRTSRPERQEFLTRVTEQITRPLLDAGWDRVKLREGRWHIRLSLPAGHPLAGTASYCTLRAQPGEFAFRHIFRTGSFEASWEIVEGLRTEIGEPLRAALPADAEVVWHASEDRSNAANDQVKITHTGGGYEGLEANHAAEWAVNVCTGWLELIGP